MEAESDGAQHLCALFSEREETYIVQSCSAMSFWVLIEGTNGEKVEVHVDSKPDRLTSQQYHRHVALNDT